MNKLYTTLASFLLGMIIGFIVATFGGSLFWLLYPHIHALFPNAAENGVIAKDLGWWDCVCIFWIIVILFKSHFEGNANVKE